MSRKKHPNKDIEKSLKYAEQKGWVVRVGCAHAWAQMYCPDNSKDCRFGRFCQVSIWSTPKNPQSHAKQIRGVIDKCTSKNE